MNSTQKNKKAPYPKIMNPEGFVQMKIIINDRDGAGVSGMGRTAWLEEVKAGRAPAPIKRGRTNLWRVEQIREYIANLGGNQ
ncbi:MAG: AlpA family transcriptional regulator [Methylobacter sp.]|nr:AlpA family transcriptional regulator [Methylobacter sp.]